MNAAAVAETRPAFLDSVSWRVMVVGMAVHGTSSSLMRTVTTIHALTSRPLARQTTRGGPTNRASPRPLGRAVVEDHNNGSFPGDLTLVRRRTEEAGRRAERMARRRIDTC